MLESKPLTWRGFSPRQKGLFGLLLAYSLLRLAYSVFAYNPIASPVISGDFRASYLEAAHWRQTGEFKLMANTNVPYPPFFYWWLFPLTYFPYPQVSAALYLAQFALFAWTLALLVKMVTPAGRVQPVEYGVAVMMALNFQPFLETLSTHKVEGLEFFLISVAILAFKEGKDVKSGGMIFLATALKYLPGILVLYFLVKREFRVLKGFFLAALLCLAAFALFFGLETAWTLGIRQTLWLVADRGADSNHLAANLEWQSLSQIINRFFARSDPSHPLKDTLLFCQEIAVSSPRAALGLGMALKSILFGGFLILIRHRYPGSQRKEAWPLILLEISLALLMLAILVQAFRHHYGILFLPAFVTTGLMIFRNWKGTGGKEKILFAVAFFLSGMLLPGGLLNRLPPHPFWGGCYARLYEWWSFPFYGFVALGAAILLLRKRFQSALLQK